MIRRNLQADICSSIRARKRRWSLPRRISFPSRVVITALGKDSSLGRVGRALARVSYVVLSCNRLAFPEGAQCFRVSSHRMVCARINDRRMASANTMRRISSLADRCSPTSALHASPSSTKRPGLTGIRSARKASCTWSSRELRRGSSITGAHT
jgi:hypothetical protein